MAREILFMHAIGEAIAAEMERDPTVLLIGEDVAGGSGAPGGPDSVGGIMGVTKGLYTKYPGRIIDTPISESALVGTGVGAAVAGMRPIVELMFVDFLGVCFDQIFNQAAKMRYMFGGKAKVPLVVRTLCGGKASASAQHSQMLTPIFTHIPGVKVVCPSNPYDLKGLLIQAIRDDDPVIFLEHKALLATKGDVPAESYAIPFGEANVLREGNDVTIVTYGLMVLFAMGVAQELAKAGVQCEVIDLRTLSPLDEDTILESVEKTGRLVIVDEAYPRCSIAADISSMVAEKGFSSLKAPIAKVTAPHCPVPFAKGLEDAFVPSPERIGEAVMRTMHYKG
jgi:pyruvate dehydrogenase E1 component beta subunit